jgi:hypothetical protein
MVPDPLHIEERRSWDRRMVKNQEYRFSCTKPRTDLITSSRRLTNHIKHIHAGNECPRIKTTGGFMPRVPIHIPKLCPRIRLVSEEGQFVGWIQRANMEDAQKSISKNWGENSGIRVEFRESDQN